MRVSVGLALMAVALFGLGAPADAITCSGYIALSNGTTADASGVNANFNSPFGCLAPVASPVFTGTGSINATGAALIAVNSNSNSYTGYRAYNDQVSALRALKARLVNAAADVVVLRKRAAFLEESANRRTLRLETEIHQIATAQRIRLVSSESIK